MSTMNPSMRNRRTVTLLWQRYLPFTLANVQAYAPVKAGIRSANSPCGRW